MPRKTKTAAATTEPASAAQVSVGPADSLPLPSPAAEPPAPRQTKQSLILDLLRREGGASLAELTAATGWLPHTARAALTGLRKKGIRLEKSRGDGATRYSAVAG